MIKAIAHNALNVTDMEMSLDFYCNKLGLTKAFEIKDDEERPWIIYLKICNGMFIELFYGGVKNTSISGNTAGVTHMCFECDDVYKTVEILRKKGVEIDVEPVQGKDKNYQAWIHDPDGNKIELMTISPESPQANS